MDSNTYKVRIVRPVFQSVIVEVQADDEEGAIAAALGQSDTIPDKEWTGTFEPENYFYDAQCVEEVQDFADDEQERGEDNQIPTDEYSKYLLLRASTFSGEGEVLYQPWLEEVDDLMLSDLCMDWSGQLEEARQGAFSIALELMKEHTNVQNKKPAKILQFKRSGDHDKIK